MSVRLAGAALFLIFTVGLGIRPAAPAPSSNTLTYALISTGTNKIPAFTTTGEDVQVMTQIYDALLQVDPKTLKVGPDLATAYTVSRDGLTWTFTLRKGVKWQRGYGDFTCADVQFTWALHQDPDTHSFYRTEADTADSVTCPGPYTAVMHLRAPFQGFLQDVVNQQPSTGWVLSKAAWDKLGRAGYEKTPVGTGPYVYESLQVGQSQTLSRNPDYWGQRPAVDTVMYVVVADSQTAALAVKSGSLDIDGTVDPITAVSYSRDPSVRLIAKPSFFIDYLAINTTVKPFDNLQVREAMRYAIDYKGLVSSVFRNFAVPGYAGLLMPGMLGYDPSISPVNVYAPDKARTLLRESGVPLPIHGFFTTYNDTKDINMAQFIAANFSAVGIELEARPLERGTLVQVRIAPTTPASVIGTIYTTDPDAAFVTFTSARLPPAGLNLPRYTRIDALYTQQHTAVTPADRLRAIKQASQRMATDVPLIELIQQQDLWLVNARVQNFEPTILFSGDPLWPVTLKQ